MDIVASVETPAPAMPPPGPAADEMAALTALVPDSAILPDPPAADVATTGVDTSTAAPGAERGGAAADEATETPVVETPTVDTEALARAEAAAKRAREGSRRYRELVEAQQRERAEVQRAAREAEQHRQEAEQARRLREDLTRDPYAALKKLGMTDQDLAERALREGTPEAAIHAIQQELAAERQARLTLEQRLQAERSQAAARQAEDAFASVADNEKAYPRLAELNPRAQLAVAKAALQQIADNGYEVSGLSDEQVAEACERFLSPKKGKAAVAAKPPPAPVAKVAAKTLTNAVAAERATAARPWHELSEDEQIAQIAASLPDPT